MVLIGRISFSHLLKSLHFIFYFFKSDIFVFKRNHKFKMLDGLLGRGSSFKCKSLIKATRTRIEEIRRRPEAKQRFLKEDLATLLSNGLDINAYKRTEDFLTGMNLLSCYDFIEQSCEYIVKQLSRLEKQQECPEECREAVASLMFAAARFSDLPELRDLRDIFQQKYGNCLEAFVNQKFLEKLSSRPPAPARKLQVLHDITSEFSIKWDSKGFEQRMGTPSICVQVDVQKADMVKQRHGFLDAKSRIQGSGEGNVVRRDNSDGHTTGRQEIVEHNHRQKSMLKQGESSSRRDDFSFHGRQTLTGNKNSYPIEKYGEELKPVGTKNSSHGKVPDNVHVGYMRDSNGISIPRKGENSEALTGNKHSYPIAKGDTEFKPARSSSLSHKKMPDNVHVGYMRPNNLGKGESSEALSREKGESAPGFAQHMGKIGTVGSSDEYFNEIDTIKSIQRGLEKESDRSKPYSIYALPPPYLKPKDTISLPPPYIKLKDDKHKASGVSKHFGSDCDAHSFDQSSRNRSNAVNSSGRTYSEPDHHDHEEQNIAPAKVKGYGHELEFDYQGDKTFLPKPRSIRRKHHKSSSSYDVGSGEDVGAVKRSSNSRRKDHSRKGLQIMFDEEHHRNDDEERLIDKLLIHYSKKPSNYDGEKLRKKLPAGSVRQIITDAGESSLYQSKDTLDMKSGVAPPPTRSVSLPREQIASPELKKSFARSNTFQPDNQARHVHPKLPDYDDLAARFAALKGR